MNVSIVIPVYNDKRYIDACLKAVESQTKKPHEVIVVDNNSTDGSIEKAKKYPFVTIVKQPVQGIAFARNAGFDEATGEIIARIDSDSVPSSDWLETLVREFTLDSGVRALTGAPDFYETIFPNFMNKSQVLFYQKLQKILTGSYFLWGSNMAIRRELWHQIRSSTSTKNYIDEDIDLSLCLVKADIPIIFKPELTMKASLLRGKLGLGTAIKYLRTWPLDYFEHGLYMRGILIGLGSVFSVIIFSPILIALSIKKHY